MWLVLGFPNRLQLAVSLQEKLLLNTYRFTEPTSLQKVLLLAVFPSAPLLGQGGAQVPSWPSWSPEAQCCYQQQVEDWRVYSMPSYLNHGNSYPEF